MENIIALDIETTGLDIYEDRIIEFSFIDFSFSKNLTCFTRPKKGIVLSDQVKEMTKISQQDVDSGEDIKKILEIVCEEVEDKIIFAHNGIKFDFPFIINECKRFNLNFEPKKFCCSKKLSEEVFPEFKNETKETSKEVGYSLIAVIKQLLKKFNPDIKTSKELKLDRLYNLANLNDFFQRYKNNFHSAQVDVKATILLVKAIKECLNISYEEIIKLSKDSLDLEGIYCPYKKHKGERWEEIPSDYLNWAIKQEWLDKKYQNTIRKILNDR
jgi:DNA polymerase III epsilon subunit-like protein